MTFPKYTQVRLVCSCRPVYLGGKHAGRIIDYDCDIHGVSREAELARKRYYEFCAVADALEASMARKEWERSG